MASSLSSSSNKRRNEEAPWNPSPDPPRPPSAVGGSCLPVLFDRRNSNESSSNASSKRLSTETDKFLAQELNGLTLAERNRNLEEIHGVATPVEESNQLIASTLEKLDTELSKIRKGTAYVKAAFLCPKHVKDPAFRLRFLRAERFHPQKAAVRMIAYFQAKLDLFGQDKLVKQITQEDLLPQDMKHLRGGSVQMYPDLKDRLGRLIYFVNAKHYDFEDVDTSTRVVWYLYEATTAQYPERQKAGTLTVVWYVDISLDPFKIRSKTSTLTKAFPIKINALHFSYSQPVIKALENVMIRTGLAPQARLRMRGHFGSHQECLYELEGFGIPRAVLPLDDSNGNERPMTEKYHAFLDEQKEKEIEEQRSLEVQDRESPYIRYPFERDILFGRGKGYARHAGNRALSECMDRFLEKYEEAPTGQKHRIVKDVMTELLLAESDAASSETATTARTQRPRFLKRAPDELDGWMLMTESEASEKISYTFRSKRKASLLQQSSSSIGHQGNMD